MKWPIGENLNLHAKPLNEQEFKYFVKWLHSNLVA